MSAPTVVFRGLAAIEGAAGTYDAILYAVTQSIKATQNWEEEVIKDVHGYDAAWLYRNEHANLDASLKLMGDSAAHAAIPATAVGAGANAGATISGLGQPFLGPGSVVNLSGFAMTALNGTWQVLSGSELDQGNAKAADGSYKLRKYANTTQNTATSTIPG